MREHPVPLSPPAMSRAQLLRVGSDRLRIRPWRSQSDAVVLVPAGEAGPLTAAHVRACVERLVANGVDRAYTAALPPADQEAFVRTGFVRHEHLHLLAHDLRALPPVPDGVDVLRARRGDRARVLAIDAAAFSGFWQIDAVGLDEALDATPVSRLRVGHSHRPGTGRSRPEGYAVFGRAGPRGYLQRLAVEPSAQGRGIGRGLVVEGLAWLQRRGADHAVVNTQAANERALALYRSLGFVQQPGGLDILVLQLRPDVR